MANLSDGLTNEERLSLGGKSCLVPRKSVKKLREMSRREGVSAGELARRAIEAYTSGNVLTEPEEEAASRLVLKDIHAQVRAVLARIDASLAEIKGSEKRLADEIGPRLKPVAERCDDTGTELQ